jgi:hypothetical protein
MYLKARLKSRDNPVILNPKNLRKRAGCGFWRFEPCEETKAQAY